MCAALKTSLGAAVDRIAKLEKRDQENGRELTSLKLKLQPRPDNEARSAYSFVDWLKLPAVTQLGTAPVGAATPPSHQEHRVATDSPITACVHELPAARFDANNAIVPPAVTTRARHLKHILTISPRFTVAARYIHTAPAEDNTSNQRSTHCFPQALCEYSARRP